MDGMRVVFACMVLAACAAEERPPGTSPPSGGPATVGEAVERGPEQAGLSGRPPPAVEEELSMRKGDEDVPVRDVIVARSPGRQELRFYRDEVDCVTARETTVHDDLFVASVPLETEPGGTLAEGPQPRALWNYRVGDEPRMLPGSEGWVTITRVPNDRTVEGRVSVLATVEDERFQLEGPFTATVCDLP